MKAFIACYIIIVCGLLTIQNVAGKEASVATLKAIYLVHISKLTTWPTEKIESSPTFSICINKNSKLSDKLKKIEQQISINEKPLKIKYDLSPKALVNCHVFYVSPADVSTFKKNKTQLEMNAVLTVSSEENFTENDGGVIGYYVNKEKVKMQVNLTAMHNINVKISSKLLRLMKKEP